MSEAKIEPALSNPMPTGVEFREFLSEPPTFGLPPGSLREELAGDGISTNHLARHITLNYRSFRKNHETAYSELAALQMYYQPAVLELLGMPELSKEAAKDLFTLYPIINSIHGQYEQIGSEFSELLIKDPAVPAHMRHVALEKWLICMELNQDPEPLEVQQHNLLKKWLVNFVQDWAIETEDETSKDPCKPDYITKIIHCLNIDADSNGHTIYIDPRNIAAIAAYITDSKLTYEFVRRHILYAPANPEDPASFSIETEKDKQLALWVRQELAHARSYWWLPFVPKKLSDEDRQLGHRLTALLANAEIG